MRSVLVTKITKDTAREPDITETSHQIGFIHKYNKRHHVPLVTDLVIRLVLFTKNIKDKLSVFTETSHQIGSNHINIKRQSTRSK